MSKAAVLEPMPQLDGLRACAVLGVMVYHFLPALELNFAAIMGVKLFFVLSGFLITGILLRSRETSEKKGQSAAITIRQFYIRRILRIFPLYYFVIAVSLLLNLEPVREVLPWLLTYTLNIHMASQGWYVDNFAHFWSLAIEEQFYLFWPWLILFTPKKFLFPVTVVVILAAPLYRGYEMFIGMRGLASFIFTLSCLDSLGMGALVAICMQSAVWQGRTRKFLNFFALPAGLALTLFFILFQKTADSRWSAIFFDLGLALFFSWLVMRASEGFKGMTGRMLESKPLTVLGKISYGIYVYHPFAPLFWVFVFNRMGLAYDSSGVINFVLSFAGTLALAALSWFLMEKPLNDLKRFFPYTVTAKSAAHGTAGEPAVPKLL